MLNSIFKTFQKNTELINKWESITILLDKDGLMSLSFLVSRLWCSIFKFRDISINLQIALFQLDKVILKSIVENKQTRFTRKTLRKGPRRKIIRYKKHSTKLQIRATWYCLINRWTNRIKKKSPEKEHNTKSENWTIE